MFPEAENPDLLVGLAADDDAAVYRVSDESAVVLTVDFITPIVDDPRMFGMIAATNSLSDIYAMGADVVLALNVAGLPKKMSPEVVREIMIGGATKVREAGGMIVGGHTINDEEPKYGLVVMGLVHPNRILTKTKARPGDVILLTKPLGTGVITTALKGGKAEPVHVQLATDWMLKLNRRASELARDSTNACTDVTGFSLLGHGLDMAEKSGVQLELDLEQIPFIDGGPNYGEQGTFPGGSRNNRSAYEHSVVFSEGIPEYLRMLLFTPETSGGLLLTIPAASVEAVRQRFTQNGEPVWQIGRVIEGSGISVKFSGDSPVLQVIRS
jgi:selenide, water dikinase